MAWAIEFTETALRQLEKFDHSAQRRIRKYLSERVATLDNPRKLGKPLQGGRFGELWRYRVGDYRLITNIEDQRVVIIVLRVGHRREVYR